MGIGTKYSTYLYWGLSFLSVFIILMTVYFYMGGFEEPNYSKSIGSEYSIAGKWYKGDRDRDAEALLFNEMRDLIALEKIQGTLCLVNYKNDTLEDRDVTRFFGVLLSNTVSSIPAGMEVLELRSSSTFQASMSMHPLVMPNTQEVEANLKSLAKEYGEELEDFTVELYFKDNSVIVELFAKE